jgi:hypothetical protein
MQFLPPSPATITVGHFDHLTIILDLQQLYYITILLTCQHFCSAAAVRLSVANNNAIKADLALLRAFRSM